MRRIVVFSSVISLLMGLLAAPVTADPPLPLSFAEEIWDINPCTGLWHGFTLNFEGYEHDGHDKDQNNYIYKGVVTGSSNDGYVIDHGREHWKWNDNHTAVMTFHHIWSNDEGSKYTVNGKMLLTVDPWPPEGTFEVRNRCIRH